MSGWDAFVESMEGEPAQGCWSAGRRVADGRREPDGLGWVRVRLGVSEARG